MPTASDNLEAEVHELEQNEAALERRTDSIALSNGLALVFAFLNHRSAERGARRVITQAAWIVGTLFMGSAVVAALVARSWPALH